MKTVYILRSKKWPDRIYTGVTGDLQRHLRLHNSGLVPITARPRPWKLVVAIQFEIDAHALDFERYLKSGSGRAFSNQHLIRRSPTETDRKRQKQGEGGLTNSPVG